MKKGFTMVELIVVIAMLMLLMGSVSSALMGARKRAKIAKATVACQEMTNAILAYENYRSLANVSPKEGPATKSTLSFILSGTETDDNGNPIPVLYNAAIKGAEILDPWNKPYRYRIKETSIQIKDDLAGGAVDTNVMFPNYNRRRAGEEN